MPEQESSAAPSAPLTLADLRAAFENAPPVERFLFAQMLQRASYGVAYRTTNREIVTLADGRRLRRAHQHVAETPLLASQEWQLLATQEEQPCVPLADTPLSLPKDNPPVRIDALSALRAAHDALRAYQHGNASPALAKEVADFLEPLLEGTA